MTWMARHWDRRINFRATQEEYITLAFMEIMISFILRGIKLTCPCESLSYGEVDVMDGFRADSYENGCAFSLITHQFFGTRLLHTHLQADTVLHVLALS